jgi:hypothetical protein
MRRVTPAQRVVLDAALRATFRPGARQLVAADALCRRGWLRLGEDGLRFSITSLGREAHAALLGPKQHTDQIVQNWERAHAARKERLNVRRPMAD